MNMKKISSYLPSFDGKSYGIPQHVDSVVNFFFDAYFAKVDERARQSFQQPPWFPADVEAHIRELWLGCELHTAVTLNQTYPAWSRALNAYAFSKLFYGPTATYRVVGFLDTYEFKEHLKGNYRYRVQSEKLSISLNESMTLPVFGNFFVEHISTGKHLFVSLDLCYEAMSCVVSVMANKDDQKSAEQFFSDMAASLAANDIYYKQCLSYVRGRLDFMGVKPTTWDQIIIKPALREQIQGNTVTILDSMEEFSKLGMVPNQNMILISPPGMAKTTIFRAISNDIDGRITRIWCTGKSILHSEDVTNLFDAARSMSPCIVIIEDMDLFGGNRSNNSYGQDNHVLNEFLACLDGAQDNAGVVVLASTNDIASMDEALVNRPGRFDMKIEIPLPDDQDRSDMLKSFLRGFHSGPDKTVTQDIWVTVIKMTDGLTGDYMRSLARAVVIQAVKDNCSDGQTCTFTANHLTGAVEQVMKNYQIGKRAKKHHIIEADITMEKSV
jgi:AAA+ superfamily predicted ATPase